MVRLCLIAALLAPGPLVRPLSAGPVIGEFMAQNDTVLKDEDLDTPDWIEIYNPDPAPVDLGGWYLTDDAAVLKKWQFPSVSLGSGGYLVVFASGKDRRNPAGRLHTNFRLDSLGDYLALVTPGGEVAFDFGPTFPPQVGDYSYGVSQGSTIEHLVVTGAPAKTLIPASGSLGLTWTQVGFDHASWTDGITGVGYDRNADYVPLIGTNVRAAMDGVNTSAYIRIPFTVADAAKVERLFFRMKYDDGYIAYLNGTKVASANAPNPPSWNSAATADHPDTVAVIFEEIDLSQYAGLLQDGPNVLAIQGLNTSTSSSDFLILPELDGVSEGEFHPEIKEYFPMPSPGYGNLPGYPGIAEKPQFSYPSQVFGNSMTLELATVSEQAVIRYTLDGSEPTPSSQAYSSPISLTGTTMVRARSFEGVLAPSPLAVETYLRIDSGLLDFETNLPIVVADTFGGSINDQSYRSVFAAIMEPGGDGRSIMSAVPDWSGRAAVKWRGSSSLGFPKKSMNFETRDEHGKDLKAPLLGFAEQSDWVLYAPYTDKTLLRDYLSYFWSNEIDRYAPRGKPVELFLNTGGGDLDGSSYQGVYILFEKIKEDDARVDLHKMHSTDTDLSGGYILKKDRIDPGEEGITTSQGHLLVFVEPNEGEVTPAQKAWIQSYMNEFEAVLGSASFTDPVNGYAKYIDVDSFIDHHILVEVTKNIDGFRLSTFMFKDRGKKLNMGPIWDYNLTLGNANYLDGWKPDGWYHDLIGPGDYPWYGRLFQDPEFAQRYVDRWALHRRGAFQTPLLMADIDTMVDSLAEAEPRDHVTWPIIGTYVWPNPQPIPQSYQGEISFMKNWLTARVSWIDSWTNSSFAAPPGFNQYGGPISPGFSLTMSGTKVYFTLDGADPRLRGGSLNTASTLYSAPLVLDRNTRVIARSRPFSKWSPLVDATFVVETPPLVITEIMYHPEPPPLGSPFDAEDFEFLELKNIGSAPLDLEGFHIGGGIEFTFPAGLPLLAPGGLAVVVDNLEAFATRYTESGLLVAGEYSGHLSNSGDAIVLQGPLKEPILDFRYSDAWYPTTDGAGRSLVFDDPSRPLSSWGEAPSWKASAALGGSPGADELTPPVPGLQLPGDGNQDGSLDLSDAIHLLVRLFLSGSGALPCKGDSLAAGGNLVLLNSNGDLTVDLSDVVHVLRHLFQSGPPPVLGTSCAPIDDCPDICKGS